MSTAAEVDHMLYRARLAERPDERLGARAELRGLDLRETCAMLERSQRWDLADELRALHRLEDWKA